MARAFPVLVIAAVVLVVGLARSFGVDVTSVGVTSVVEPSVEGVGASVSTSDAEEPRAPVEFVRIPEGMPPDLVLASRPSSVSGRIAGVVLGGRDGATPLASASVLLWRHGVAPREERRCVTDAKGRFEITNLDAAAWWVEVSAESHGDTRRITLLPPRNTGIELEVVVPIWRDMRFRLVSPDGPISDFSQVGLDESLRYRLSVRIGRASAKDVLSFGNGRASGPRVAGTTQSQSDSLDRIDLGDYVYPTDVVHVLLGWQVIASRPLPDDERVTDVVVSLADVRRVSIPVQVRVSAAGSRKPIAGAVVEIRGFKGSGIVHTARTDASGRATWKDAPPVQLHVTAYAEGFVALSKPVERVRTGADEFELVAGRRLAGKIPVKRRGVELSLWKLPPDKELLGPTLQTTNTGWAGEFDFGTVPLGQYVVAASDAQPADVRGSQIATSPAFVIVSLTSKDVVDVLVPWKSAAKSEGPR